MKVAIQDIVLNPNSGLISLKFFDSYDNTFTLKKLKLFKISEQANNDTNNNNINDNIDNSDNNDIKFSSKLLHRVKENIKLILQTSTETNNLLN